MPTSEADVRYLELSYSGSRFFQPLGDKYGLQIDRLNFIITQFVALLFAYVYRKIFSYHHFPYWFRLRNTLIPGICLGWFCYGHDVIHVLVIGIVCYIAMKCASPERVHLYVMFLALAYLSKLHLYRQWYDYGGYILDITGPIMIATQKVTSLSFNIFDGKRPDSQLTPEQRRLRVTQVPNLLEYFSYLFTFQTLMCGPLVYYIDFIEFITGRNVEKYQPHPIQNRTILPSPRDAVLWKLATSIFYATLVLTIGPKIDCSYLTDEPFLRNSSLFTYIMFALVATFGARFKYYFAWKFGETICNASGLGFQGWKSDGKPDWDLVACLDIWKVETCLNLKVFLDNWNKTTQSWLRICAYDRTPASFRTLATFVLSAMWHGFYPGYYFTFLTGVLITNAARSGRRKIRPLFQTTLIAKHLYDVITFILTRIFVMYAAAPFVLLSMESSLKFYRKTCYFGHIGCIVLIIGCMFVRTPHPHHHLQNDRSLSTTTHQGNGSSHRHATFPLTRLQHPHDD